MYTRVHVHAIGGLIRGGKFAFWALAEHSTGAQLLQSHFPRQSNKQSLIWLLLNKGKN